MDEQKQTKMLHVIFVYLYSMLAATEQKRWRGQKGNLYVFISSRAHLSPIFTK